MTDHDREQCLREYARSAAKTRTGVGMKPPFYVEVASVKGDDRCGYIVRNAACNSLGRIIGAQEAAQIIADEMNAEFKATGEA
jgi:hypothetical protein